MRPEALLPMHALVRLRNRLVPEALGLGWMPIALLGYLLFLFLPVLVPADTRWSRMPWELGPTLASIVVFLPLYFLAYRGSTLVLAACTVVIALLGYGVMPFNAFSNTYVVYAAGFAAMLRLAPWIRLAVLVAVCAGYTACAMALGFPMFVPAITLIVSVAVFSGNYFHLENVRKRAELKLSHDEVRRLAALAERERIGRDLHDLLGHTLSLVALKSDLAARLVQSDPDAARREIAEVSRVARDALSQVRRAVTGIRAAGLAAELASARLLLEADGVTLEYDTAGVMVPPELETVLALCVREAVTNIQRHAHASLANVSVSRSGDEVILRIRDNGVGSAIVPGNGLTGMGERVNACGGRLRIESTLRQGTCVEVALPVVPEPAPPPTMETSPPRAVDAA